MSGIAKGIAAVFGGAAKAARKAASKVAPPKAAPPKAPAKPANKDDGGKDEPPPAEQKPPGEQKKPPEPAPPQDPKPQEEEQKEAKAKDALQQGASETIEVGQTHTEAQPPKHDEGAPFVVPADFSQGRPRRPVQLQPPEDRVAKQAKAGDEEARLLKTPRPQGSRKARAIPQPKSPRPQALGTFSHKRWRRRH
jgi:hypothetical protein